MSEKILGRVIELTCEECRRVFKYFKKSNFDKRFCKECAQKRIIASKQRSLTRAKRAIQALTFTHALEEKKWRASGGIGSRGTYDTSVRSSGGAKAALSKIRNYDISPDRLISNMLRELH